MPPSSLHRLMRGQCLHTVLWAALSKEVAGATGLEPATSAVTGQRSNQLNYSRVKESFGRNRTRTYDHLCVRQALYQLSYTPFQRKSLDYRISVLFLN